MRRPEWTDVELDRGYRVTIFLVGDDILVGQPTGYVTVEAVRNVTALSARIADEHFGPGRPYFHMQDYTGLTGTSLRARRLFIEAMKSRQQVRCLVFWGVSPFFRIAVQLAKRLHGFPYEFRFVDNLPEAVRLVKGLPVPVPAPCPARGEGEKRSPIAADHSSDLTKQHVHDLLHYLESLDWGKGRTGPAPEVSPAHPFLPVFRTFDLIRRELDDLSHERRMVEEALRKTQAELWQKIADLSAELAAVRKEAHTGGEPGPGPSVPEDPDTGR